MGRLHDDQLHGLGELDSRLGIEGNDAEDRLAAGESGTNQKLREDAISCEPRNGAIELVPAVRRRGSHHRRPRTTQLTEPNTNPGLALHHARQVGLFQALVVRPQKHGSRALVLGLEERKCPRCPRRFDLELAELGLVHSWAAVGWRHLEGSEAGFTPLLKNLDQGSGVLVNLIRPRGDDVSEEGNRLL